MYRRCTCSFMVKRDKDQEVQLDCIQYKGQKYESPKKLCLESVCQINRKCTSQTNKVVTLKDCELDRVSSRRKIKVVDKGIITLERHLRFTLDLCCSGSTSAVAPADLQQEQQQQSESVSAATTSEPSDKPADPMINFAHFYPAVSGSARHLTTAPRPLVICGPSGSGKSTLLRKLMAEFGDYFGFSVSHTTRNPREGEEDGREYYFTDRDEMLGAIGKGDFIEHTEFSGNIYGTSKKSVQDVQNKGRICILDVEIEGVKSLKKTDLNPRFVFLKPPSVQALEQRLRCRGTECEESVRKRLGRALEEMAYGETPGNFDLVIVNEDVDEAYANLRNFVLRDVEELKKSRSC